MARVNAKMRAKKNARAEKPGTFECAIEECREDRRKTAPAT